MKKKLETRKSAQFLLTLEGAGRIDSRSEMGTVVDIHEWQQKPSFRFHCSCEQVRDTEELIPSHLIVTDEHLYILRLTDERRRMVIKSRHALKSIMKITTNAKISDMVKIQYGSKADDKTVHITDSDQLHIPKQASQAIKAIKCSLLSGGPQRRLSTDEQLHLHPPTHLMERRPSMIAEDRRHFIKNDELSMAKYRRNSTASFCHRRPRTAEAENDLTP